MSTAVALVCRVARRRVERGEELTEVLKDYPPPDGGTESGDRRGIDQRING